MRTDRAVSFAAFTTAVARVVSTACVCALLIPRDASAQAFHETCPVSRDVPSQIRSTSCVLIARVATGLNRSETFRALVERVGVLKGIVYIEEGRYWNPDANRILSGALEHRVTAAGAFRLLRIRIAPEPGDRPVSTIAHELRHAIELLESDATTEREIDALFARIGAPAGAWVWETAAASAAERAVRRELGARSGATDATTAVR